MIRWRNLIIGVACLACLLIERPEGRPVIEGIEPSLEAVQ